MKKLFFVFAAFLSVVLLFAAGCQKRSAVIVDSREFVQKDYARPLPPGELALRKISDPDQIPDFTKACSDLDGLLEAIENSLNYLAKPSRRKYYPYGEITHDRAVKSLEELKKLILSGLSPDQFNKVLRERFDTYVSVGCDNQGTVLFTGYYTPIFDGSLVRTDRFQYPLYRTPPHLVKDPEGIVLGRRDPSGKIEKFPDRKGLKASQILTGLELIWLGDPFEVYIVHVQGSAKIRLPDGQIKAIGYDAHNGWDYQSIVPAMIADGKISGKNINLKVLIDYFKAHPQEVDPYTNLNPRFVFFRFEDGAPKGSLNVPVTAFRTIATDKSIYPRAMFAFAAVDLERPVGFVLDQDTGGAIRAAGRCDVYKGLGDQAGKLAGGTYREGKLYYLFLK
jgi:membrane-bound lytic murein transglycosylase A